jgi:hypothetical protein
MDGGRTKEANRGCGKARLYVEAAGKQCTNSGNFQPKYSLGEDGTMNLKWSEDELNNLIKLHKRGIYTYAQLSDMLKRSKYAVYNKVYELRLEGRIKW